MPCPLACDPAVGACRNVVERCFARLEQFARGHPLRQTSRPPPCSLVLAAVVLRLHEDLRDRPWFLLVLGSPEQDLTRAVAGFAVVVEGRATVFVPLPAVRPDTPMNVSPPFTRQRP
ncbi:hypothetical protein ACI8AA_01700 [Geodermatophilus sp. SYSU D01180]